MQAKAGEFYAEIICPDCHGNGACWFKECGRCRSRGTIIVRCCRCACGRLIGAYQAARSDVIFKTAYEGVRPATGCGCSDLPNMHTLSTGHLRYNPPPPRSFAN